MDLNNKKLDQIRENDKLIYELINSTLFKVSKTGEIWSKNGTGTTEPSGKWRRVDNLSKNSGYKSVSFKYKHLNVGRIVFAKFGSVLIAEKVINHIDGNKINNNINNLELITHSENNTHRYQILEGKEPKPTKIKLGRSGMILAVYDDVIRDLLNNKNYDVRSDGTVWTNLTVTGKKSVKDVWREAGSVKKAKSTEKKEYYYVKYRYVALKRSRIIQAKFGTQLQMDLVVNHIDGNTLNDKPNNLELVTQSHNNKHTYRNLGYRPVISNNKITQEIADKIRLLQKSGFTNKQLREKFSVSKSTISYVVNNRIWLNY